MAFIIEKKKKNARESEKKLDGKGIVLTENFGIWNAQERKGEDKKVFAASSPLFSAYFHLFSSSSLQGVICHTTTSTMCMCA